MSVNFIDFFPVLELITKKRGAHRGIKRSKNFLCLRVYMFTHSLNRYISAAGRANVEYFISDLESPKPKLNLLFQKSTLGHCEVYKNHLDFVRSLQQLIIHIRNIASIFIF